MASTLSASVLSKYKNNIFVETGTSQGDGVKLALDCGFTQIYSIEVNPDLVQFNREQFREFGDRVQIFHGDSSEVLHTLLPIIQEPATFWLDGHWDGGPEGKYRCPLLYELAEIARHPIKTHSLLVDDRRLFGVMSHQWGREVTELAVITAIKAINENYTVVYEDGFIPNDIIAATIR